MFARRHIDDECDTSIGKKPLRWRRHRRAFTIVELIGTLVLLGVVFTCSISVLLAVARERRSTEQRQYAIQYANNVLEHATARPWSKLTTGIQKIPDASAELQLLLPELDQQLELTDPSADGSRQFAFSIRWKNQQGHFVAPIQLVAWVYPLEETQP